MFCSNYLFWFYTLALSVNIEVWTAGKGVLVLQSISNNFMECNAKVQWIPQRGSLCTSLPRHKGEWRSHLEVDHNLSSLSVFCGQLDTQNGEGDKGRQKVRWRFWERMENVVKSSHVGNLERYGKMLELHGWRMSSETHWRCSTVMITWHFMFNRIITVHNICCNVSSRHIHQQCRWSYRAFHILWLGLRKEKKTMSANISCLAAKETGKGHETPLNLMTDWCLAVFSISTWVVKR